MNSLHVIAQSLASELHQDAQHLENILGLLDAGQHAPFLAHYRKASVAPLDMKTLQILRDHLHLRDELQEKKTHQLQSLKNAQVCTPALEKRINDATSAQRLDDLYLPYHQQRRTRATMAKEAGLAPLADRLCQDFSQSPQEHALHVIDPHAEPQAIAAALRGAAEIIMERLADDPDLLAFYRDYLWQNASLHSSMLGKKTPRHARYAPYFDYQEKVNQIAPQDALALSQGRQEQALQWKFSLPESCDPLSVYIRPLFSPSPHDPCEPNPGREWLETQLQQAWKNKLWTKLTADTVARLRDLATNANMSQLRAHFYDLLWRAPLGPQRVLGLDASQHANIKAIVVDTDQTVLDDAIILPFASPQAWFDSIADLARLAAKYHVTWISISKSKGTRQVERLVSALMAMYPDLQLKKSLVSDVGIASNAPASCTTEEQAQRDPSFDGAVSIARRLQDPLTELMSMDPLLLATKWPLLHPSLVARCFTNVVEECIHRVGVDVNQVNAKVLAKISGFNASLAENLVAYRQQQGRFRHRQELKHIPGMNDDLFEQSAGFLRIYNGDHPFDASSIHPNAYAMVESLLNHIKKSGDDGDHSLSRGADRFKTYQNDDNLFAAIVAHWPSHPSPDLMTPQDLMEALQLGGRDPRPAFVCTDHPEHITHFTHLKVNQRREGTVARITPFGVFVDLGVHQDGLVHISEITHRFIQHPEEVLSVGEKIMVRVLSVDRDRRRISLSMKMEREDVVQNGSQSKRDVKKPASAPPEVAASKPTTPRKKNNLAHQAKKSISSTASPLNTSMADAFNKLKPMMSST